MLLSVTLQGEQKIKQVAASFICFEILSLAAMAAFLLEVVLIFDG